jgi:UrcA family protein
VLVGRVKHAAADICGQRPEVLLDVAANQRFNACMNKTVGEAMAKVPASAIVAGSTRPNG